MMRKYILPFFLALLLIGCAQKSNLKKQVEIDNARCPYELEEGATITKMELLDDRLAVYVEISGDFDDYLDDADNREVLGSGLKAWFTDADTPFPDLTDALIAEGTGIGFAIKNSQGTKAKIEYSAYDLESSRQTVDEVDEEEEASSTIPAYNNTEDIDFEDLTTADIDKLNGDQLEEALNEGINLVSAELPMVIDDDMSITGIRLTEYNLIYTIRVTESDELSVSMFQFADTEIKAAMKEQMRNGDKDMKLLCRMLIKTNRGIDYRFIGRQSGDSYTVHLTTSDIRQNL